MRSCRFADAGPAPAGASAAAPEARCGAENGADRRTVSSVEEPPLAAHTPPTIAYDDFANVDIRAGTIVAAAPLAKARKPAYVLDVDFGAEIGIKHSSAQVTLHYDPSVLIGRQVAAVVNFPPKRIAGVLSEVLVLGFPDAAGAVVLVRPDRSVPNGARLF